MERDLSDIMGFGGIKDLAFTDIFILLYLQRFKGSTVRITLLETLNAFLSPNDELSPSSFYNRLKRLKRKGFIGEDNKLTRGQKISITEFGLQALAKINEMTVFSTVDFYKHTLNVLPNIQKDIPELEKSAEKLLIVNLEVGLDMDTIQLISKFGSDSYIAAEDTTYNRYIGRGMPEEIKQSYLDNQTVREPNEWFDRILIIGLDTTEHADQIPIWIEEAYRLLKIGGLFVVSTLAEFSNQNHFVLNQVTDDMMNNRLVHIANAEFLRTSLEKSNFKDVNEKNYEGLLVVWGKK